MLHFKWKQADFNISPFAVQFLLFSCNYSERGLASLNVRKGISQYSGADLCCCLHSCLSWMEREFIPAARAVIQRILFKMWMTHENEKNKGLLLGMCIAFREKSPYAVELGYLCICVTEGIQEAQSASGLFLCPYKSVKFCPALGLGG